MRQRVADQRGQQLRQQELLLSQLVEQPVDLFGCRGGGLGEDLPAQLVPGDPARASASTRRTTGVARTDTSGPAWTPPVPGSAR